jgi:hypothetical protein
MLMLPSSAEADAATNTIQRTGLKGARLRRLLVSPAFTEELSHLLRRRPKLDGVSRDAGVACRDNALIVAACAAALGHTVQICSGEAAFIGPVETTAQNNVPGYLHLEVHSWVDINGFGICDLSPDLGADGGFGWLRWPVKYLVGGSYIPNMADKIGRYCTDATTFAGTVDAALSDPHHFRTAYFEKTREPYTNTLFVGAVNFALSPLLKELSTRPFFSLNILGKAAVHIRNVSKGRAKSLRHMEQMAAWAEIARISDSAVENLRARLAFIDDPQLP